MKRVDARTTLGLESEEHRAGEDARKKALEIEPDTSECRCAVCELCEEGWEICGQMGENGGKCGNEVGG